MSDRSNSADDTDETDVSEPDAPETVEGDTTLAALSHASALVASFLGPLLFLILAADGDELVERNAKNSLNFQILVFVAIMVSGLLTFVFIGILLLPLIGVIDVVLVLIATLKANDGEIYSYPFTPDIL